MDAYEAFLARKAVRDPATGLSDIGELPAQLFNFQRDITRWALRRGRAALFAGTGLGKSFMELSWADQVARVTGKPILHLAPLAVSAQMVREARKFGIAAHQVSVPRDCDGGINITNYQKIEHFRVSDFGGVILDESSILKSVDGKFRSKLIRDCADIPFRLAATATPAPNDYMELGNHAEFLGVMSYTDMLATFFVHDGGDTQAWRLKGHAEDAFWKWMASWAVMLRKPSDLGYSDEGYDLPPLTYEQHVVGVEYAPNVETGLLFPMQASTLSERIAARRGTVAERVGVAVSLVLNDTCDKLAKCLGSQNTPPTGEPNIKLIPTSANGASSRDDLQKPTPNTCATITPKIRSDLGAPTSNRQSSISDVEKSTQQTLNIESAVGNYLEIDAPRASVEAGSSLSTASIPGNMSGSSPNKAADAPSAEPSQSDIYPLITAIAEAKSAGFFAPHAIPASVISKMTQSGCIEPWCIWCNLNSEQEALAKALGPLAYSVTGSMSDEAKEAAIIGWIEGRRPFMISKATIMGFGMNFQHCRHMVSVGLTDSWEQFYQAVRRFWRFGQTRPVTVHLIAAETEGAVVANLRRKEIDADRMAAAMVRHMADLSSVEVRGLERDRGSYNPTLPLQIPQWLKAS